MVLLDLILLALGIIFAWLALTQLILPIARGTKVFPALHPAHRVLASEERRVLTETDHALQRIEIAKLRERLKVLETQSTEAPKGQEAEQHDTVR